MNEFQATTVMVALFALRCIVPLLLMAAVGYGMNKLVDRWEGQQSAARDARPAIPLPVVPRAAPRPAASSVPCWVFKNCDEQTRARCPAYQKPSLACWVAIMRTEGQVSARCAGCERYTGMPALAVAD